MSAIYCTAWCFFTLLQAKTRFHASKLHASVLWIHVRKRTRRGGPGSPRDRAGRSLGTRLGRHYSNARPRAVESSRSAHPGNGLASGKQTGGLASKLVGLASKLVGLPKCGMFVILLLVI